MFQYKSDEPQAKRNMISSTANLVYELPHKLSNDLRLRILGNKKILRKSQIWVEMQPCAQSSFQKLNFGNSSEKTHKNRYQTCLVLSSFTEFLYFVPNILPRIVAAARGYTVEPVLKTTSIKRPPLHNNHSQVHPSNIWYYLHCIDQPPV